jgi:hypothetical protein
LAARQLSAIAGNQAGGVRTEGEACQELRRDPYCSAGSFNFLLEICTLTLFIAPFSLNKMENGELTLIFTSWNNPKSNKEEKKLGYVEVIPGTTLYIVYSI